MSTPQRPERAPPDLSAQTLRPGSLPPVFLVRASYRRRRLADAARLLPVGALLLFLVPLLWPTDGSLPMSRAMLYIFGVWIALIGVVAVFGRLARRVDGQDTPSDLTAAPREDVGP